MKTLLGLFAVFVLVFVNGFFVAAEFALVGARRTRIAQLADDGHAGARAAQHAIHHLDNYIAATQLGITLASLGLGWIGEPVVAGLVEHIFELVLPEKAASAAAHSVAIAVGFSIVTTLHIVLGELSPKAIALQKPETVAILVARPTTWFLRFFSPVIHAMNAIGNGVVRLLGFEPASGHERVHSAEELVMLVEAAHEAGVLEASEERLLHRAFDFSDTLIRDVMQPRVEVEAIALGTPLPQVFETVSTGPYSRYPVYDGTIDNVVGLLHTKDLLDLVVHHPELLSDPQAHHDLRPLLREPLFVPELVPVARVLEQMQHTKTPFAVVIDEFGGMAGIATMEDILEELVGDVQDEFDSEEFPTEETQEAVVVDGLMTLHELADRFGPPPTKPLSTTIGGYIAERLDRIPKEGDRVNYGDYDVIVEDMDELRVTKVRFVARPRTVPPSDAEGTSPSAPAAPP